MKIGFAQFIATGSVNFTSVYITICVLVFAAFAREMCLCKHKGHRSDSILLMGHSLYSPIPILSRLSECEQ